MQDDIVDKIIAEPAFVIQDKFSITEKYSGAFSSVELRFRVLCDSSYYGSTCGRFCLETNNDTGHYVCDNNGNKVCMDGYLDPDSNCTKGLHLVALRY